MPSALTFHLCTLVCRAFEICAHAQNPSSCLSGSCCHVAAFLMWTIVCALRSHSQLLHVIKFISIIVLKFHVLHSASCSALNLLPVWLVHLLSPCLLLSLVALAFACLTTSCVVQTSVFHNSSECFFQSHLHCGFCQTCSGLYFCESLELPTKMFEKR